MVIVYKTSKSSEQNWHLNTFFAFLPMELTLKSLQCSDWDFRHCIAGGNHYHNPVAGKSNTSTFLIIQNDLR